MFGVESSLVVDSASLASRCYVKERGILFPGASLTFFWRGRCRLAAGAEQGACLYVNSHLFHGQHVVPERNRTITCLTVSQNERVQK